MLALASLPAFIIRFVLRVTLCPKPIITIMLRFPLSKLLGYKYDQIVYLERIGGKSNYIMNIPFHAKLLLFYFLFCFFFFIIFFYLFLKTEPGNHYYF